MPFFSRKYIPENELRFVFARSSGAGGQNINKTSTKVSVYWRVDNSDLLSALEKELVKSKLRNRLTHRGELVVVSETERSQLRNRNLAVTRLNVLVNKALEVKKKRYSTKPTYASKLRRIASKKIRSKVKAARRTVND